MLKKYKRGVIVRDNDVGDVGIVTKIKFHENNTFDLKIQYLFSFDQYTHWSTWNGKEIDALEVTSTHSTIENENE